MNCEELELQKRKLHEECDNLRQDIEDLELTLMKTEQDKQARVGTHRTGQAGPGGYTHTHRAGQTDQGGYTRTHTHRAGQAGQGGYTQTHRAGQAGQGGYTDTHRAGQTGQGGYTHTEQDKQAYPRMGIFGPY